MLDSSRMAACALAAALLSPAQAAPVIELAAAQSSSGFDLTVSARDVVDLYGYQFTLNFDPSLLGASGTAEGSFLRNAGSFFSPGSVDAVAGTISFVAGTLLGPVGGVSGSGPLATFSFDVQRAGLARFSLTDVMVVDSTGAEIGVDVRGLVTAVPEPASYLMFAVGLAAVLGGRGLRRHARRS